MAESILDIKHWGNNLGVRLPAAVARAAKIWVPDRQDIIWIDCNPQAGCEMRDRHPFIVLSPRAFKERTSLVIGLPMTTAEYNADNPFAVVAGKAGGAKADTETVAVALSESDEI
jgi:mRNA interferase MazF